MLGSWDVGLLFYPTILSLSTTRIFSNFYLPNTGALASSMPTIPPGLPRRPDGLLARVRRGAAAAPQPALQPVQRVLRHAERAAVPARGPAGPPARLLVVRQRGRVHGPEPAQRGRRRHDGRPRALPRAVRALVRGWGEGEGRQADGQAGGALGCFQRPGLGGGDLASIEKGLAPRQGGKGVGTGCTMICLPGN